MKEPENTTADIIEINGTRIALKARPDESAMNPSGWSIIAFAPSASVRCVRANQHNHLDLFIRSVMALGGCEVIDPELFTDIEERVHKVTQGAFK